MHLLKTCRNNIFSVAQAILPNHPISSLFSNIRSMALSDSSLAHLLVGCFQCWPSGWQCLLLDFSSARHWRRALYSSTRTARTYYFLIHLWRDDWCLSTFLQLVVIMVDGARFSLGFPALRLLSTFLDSVNKLSKTSPCMTSTSDPGLFYQLTRGLLFYSCSDGKATLVASGYCHTHTDTHWINVAALYLSRQTTRFKKHLSVLMAKLIPYSHTWV